MFIVFLVITAITATITILQGINIRNKKKDGRTRVIFILSVLATICSASFSVYEKYSENEEKRMKSNLAIISSDFIIYPKLRIKNTGVVVLAYDGVFTFDEVLKNGDTKDLMTLKVVNNKLVTDFILKDSKGNTIINLNRNQMKMYDPQGYDFNFDDKVIEVVTHDKKVIFQLEYKDDEAIFCGFIVKSDTSGVFIKGLSKETREYTTQDAIEVNVKKNADFTIYGEGIKPLFKYPKELNFGVRNED